MDKHKKMNNSEQKHVHDTHHQHGESMAGHARTTHGHEHSAHHDHDGGKHQDHGSHHAHMVVDFKTRFWLSLALTVPVLILSPMIQSFLGIDLRFKGDLFISFLISTAVFVYGGWPFVKGMVNELRQKHPGMMTLIGLAISVAYFYSTAVVFGVSGKVFYWELSTLIVIMLLGHWIEMRSVMGASRALEELAQLMPAEAHKIMSDGNVQDVPTDELKKGDRVLVKPGEKISADGKIVDGVSSVNEAMVTGESTPVNKRKDDQVIGGSVNGEGSLTIQVEKTGAASFLSQVINMVRQAQQSKSQTQDLANRAAFWLTLIAITAGIITLVAWLAVVNRDFAFSLERTVTVMVITCPHALGLAIPLVVAVSTAISARNGLLIRNRASFEKARQLDAILFDKTGTLTLGQFGVTDTVIFDESMDEEQLLKMAAAVESHSEHPIARAIVNSVADKKQVHDFKAIPGKGAQGTVDGKHIKVVSPVYAHEQNIDIESEQIDEFNKQGKTVVFVLQDDELKGAIALADIIRDESKQAITRLKKMNIHPMMLTGDNKQVAKWVAGELDLDEYFAEVLPQDKSAKVKEVQSRGMTVAMTGDGVNDAPALAQADVGIAVGAGTDVAVETADIVLVRSNPLDVVAIVQLARATYRKMVQNLIWATGYNAIAIPLAAGVLYTYGILLSPALGAVLMSLSTVIVAINARFLSVASEH